MTTCTIVVKKTYTPRDWLAQRYYVHIINSSGGCLALKDGPHESALMLNAAKEYAAKVSAVTGFPVEITE